MSCRICKIHRHRQQHALTAAAHALLKCAIGAQVPDGDWFCAFNPDPSRRSCSIPEQTLEDDADGDGQLAVLRAPGFVPAGGAEVAAELRAENIKFFQQLLAQRVDSSTARPAPMRTVWWLATEAAVPVSFACSLKPRTAGTPLVSSPRREHL